MKIKSFNKSNLKVLREEINKALKKAGMKDVEFSVGNCRFDATEATFKLGVKVKGGKTRADLELEHAVKLNKWAMSKGGYTIVGYRPSNWKYPYLFTGPQGGRYKGDKKTMDRLFG